MKTHKKEIITATAGTGANKKKELQKEKKYLISEEKSYIETEGESYNGKPTVYHTLFYTKNPWFKDSCPCFKD